MDLWIILLTIIIGLYLISLFGTWKRNNFRKLGVPHLKPTPIFGILYSLVFKRKSVPDLFQQIYDVHPDAKYIGFFDLKSSAILIKDPELLKSIAIKNFDSFTNHRMFGDIVTEPLFAKNLFALKDDEWRNMRALLSPAFTSSKMKMMFKVLSPTAINFANHLAELDPKIESVDMKEMFSRYTLDVIASAAFGLEINSMKNRENEFYRLGKAIADFSGFRMLKFILLSLSPRLAKIFNMRFLDDKTANFFTNLIATTIATRESQGIVRPDMLQLMMQANDRIEKTPLSFEDITAQAFIFFLGGFDSPATAMSFATHLLALNPHVQTKLQEEIDQVLEKSSGQVSYEDLHAMKYLDAVVSETLRMFPPAAVMDRVTSKSFVLPPSLPGLEPFAIEPGQHLTIPIYSFHHDPRYFPEPEKFDPERFSDENKSKISPITYFPFGMGPRICIANRFALMEVKLALFYLLSKCNLLTTSKTQTPIKISPKSFVMTPEGGIWLKIVPRK